MTYIVSAEAEADLEEIGDYIAQDNPERADTFIEEIRARFDSISDMPRAYPERPEIDDGVRACVHGQYVIFYCVTETTVEIARVLHGARNITRLFQPWARSRYALNERPHLRSAPKR
jgi:toxin ParE1/3/4